MRVMNATCVPERNSELCKSVAFAVRLHKVADGANILLYFLMPYRLARVIKPRLKLFYAVSYFFFHYAT